MLNREVCESCVKIQLLAYYTYEEARQHWLDRFRDFWDTTRCCKCVKTGNDFKETDDPPNFCPYILEHTVNKNA